MQTPQRTVFTLFVLFSFVAFDLRFFSNPQRSHLFCHFVALLCVNRLLFGLRSEFIVCWIVERCRLIRHEVIAVLGFGAAFSELIQLFVVSY